MAWNAEHKLQSREKILAAAAKLFTRKGFAAVSIDEIMKDAGLTRGAFYSHFTSKSDIYNQSVLFGANQARKHIQANGINSVLAFAENYLKIGTPETELEYCSLAFLITDIAQQDLEVKSTYTKVLKGYQKILVTLGLSKDAAIEVSTLLIGGLALSRSMTDKLLKKSILQNSLDAVKKIVDCEAMRDGH